jgi:hypothetical protein
VTGYFPADAILVVAKQQKCDLIFMASHGCRELVGVFLGRKRTCTIDRASRPRQFKE